MATVGILAVAVAVAAPAAATGAASSTAPAVAAKKKCKKKAKKATSAGKRKGCRKKRKKLKPPAPAVRGQLDWVGSAADLHVFDALGNHAGKTAAGVVENTIPDSTISPDAVNGTEAFTDLRYQQAGPSTREFSYVICVAGPVSGYLDGGFTRLKASGALDGYALKLRGYVQTPPYETRGVPVPATFHCPALGSP